MLIWELLAEILPGNPTSTVAARTQCSCRKSSKWPSWFACTTTCTEDWSYTSAATADLRTPAMHKQQSSQKAELSNCVVGCLDCLHALDTGNAYTNMCCLHQTESSSCMIILSTQGMHERRNSASRRPNIEGLFVAWIMGTSLAPSPIERQRGLSGWLSLILLHTYVCILWAYPLNKQTQYSTPLPSVQARRVPLPQLHTLLRFLETRATWHHHCRAIVEAQHVRSHTLFEDFSWQCSVLPHWFWSRHLCSPWYRYAQSWSCHSFSSFETADATTKWGVVCVLNDLRMSWDNRSTLQSIQVWQSFIYSSIYSNTPNQFNGLDTLYVGMFGTISLHCWAICTATLVSSTAYTDVSPAIPGWPCLFYHRSASKSWSPHLREAIR